MTEPLERLLVAARRRLFRRELERRLAVGLRLALAAGVALLAADRLWRLRFEPLWVIGALLVAATLAGLGLAWRRRPTLLQVAFILDDRLGLAERLSSAVALATSERSEPARPALLADAARRAAEVDLRRALPTAPPPETKICLVLAGLLCLLPWLPRLSLWQSETERATELVSRQVGEELRETGVRLAAAADRAKADEAARQARALLREALLLRRARLSKEEALRRLERRNQELTAAREKLAGRPLERSGREARRELRQLGEFGRDLAETLEDPRTEAARELLRQLAEQARSGQLTPEAARQAAEELRRAAEALRDSPYAELAEALAAAAERLTRAGGQPSADLAETLDAAADSLETGVGEANRELLEELQEQLQGGKGALGDAEALLREAESRTDGQCPGGLCERYGPGAGAGRAGTSRGPGTTNESAAPGPAEESGPRSAEPEATPPTDTRAEYERLYAPRRTETLQRDERVAGRASAGGTVATRPGRRTAPELGDPRVPYGEVIEDYAAAADDALARGEIPLTQRQRVKRYFETLAGESH